MLRRLRTREEEDIIGLRVKGRVARKGLMEGYILTVGFIARAVFQERIFCDTKKAKSAQISLYICKYKVLKKPTNYCK